MPERLLFDTDILIQYLRDDQNAVRFLEHRDEVFLVSTVTIAEIYTGARTPEEISTIDQFFSGFESVPVSGRITRQGGLLRQQYYPDHGTGLADALIAATALDVEARLVTFNIKHYPMLDKILVPYSR